VAEWNYFLQYFRGKNPATKRFGGFFFAHFVEHVTKREAQVFAGECLPVLKHCGIVRIIVPNLGGAARNYLPELDNLRKDGPIIDVCPANALISHIAVCGPPRRWFRPMDWYQVWLDYHRHFWMYHRQSLAILIALGGFESVAVDNELQDSEVPFLSEVEREGALGLNGGGFVIEARKPSSVQLSHV
jgi:hypothetical protein